jgi:hypothetical protein
MSFQATIVFDEIDTLRRHEGEALPCVHQLQERPHRRRVMLHDIIPQDAPLTHEGIVSLALRSRPQKRQRNRVVVTSGASL